MAKTFTKGEAVEFIRNTDHGRGWEAGTYSQSMDGQISRGWHEVHADNATRNVRQRTGKLRLLADAWARWKSKRFPPGSAEVRGDDAARAAAWAKYEQAIELGLPLLPC